MTVRLAQATGMQYISDTARRFGISENMPLYLPNALGADQTTVMKLTTAYAMLANGGRAVEATLIDRLQDRYGKTLVKHDKRKCNNCVVEGGYKKNLDLPRLIDSRPQVTDKASAYQIVSMLQGVVRRGTGARVGREFPRKVIAGKTGTTNDSFDSWFLGFTPELVVGVYAGFDLPRSLGMYNDYSFEAGVNRCRADFHQFYERRA